MLYMPMLPWLLVYSNVKIAITFFLSMDYCIFKQLGFESGILK